MATVHSVNEGCDVGENELFRTDAAHVFTQPRPKADVHGVICPHLIEYSVIPASPQSAAGLNVFSDIGNCLGR